SSPLPARCRPGWHDGRAGCARSAGCWELRSARSPSGWRLRRGNTSAATPMSAVADVIFDRSMPSPARIAHAILEGFNRHYRLFRYVAQQAKSFYENGDWQRMRERARERIDFYDQRVLEAVARIEREFDLASLEDTERDALWQGGKEQHRTTRAAA